MQLIAPIEPDVQARRRRSAGFLVRNRDRGVAAAVEETAAALSRWRQQVTTHQAEKPHNHAVSLGEAEGEGFEPSSDLTA